MHRHVFCIRSAGYMAQDAQFKSAQLYRDIVLQYLFMAGNIHLQNGCMGHPFSSESYFYIQCFYVFLSYHRKTLPSTETKV